MTINQNLNVLGSASIQYITSSQLNIADNIISVNTSTPAIRFGGFSVIDSGSNPQQSGSILFDSVENQWIFVHQTAGTVTSSLLLMGPQTYNSIGSEVSPTPNRLIKSLNAEHLGDSNISDSGATVSINSNTQITGSLSVSAGIVGSITATNGLVSSSQQIQNYNTFAVTASNNTYYGENTFTNKVTHTNGYVVLTQVSQSLNFVDDAAASAGGVPLGGLYRNGNFIVIRIV